MGAFLPINAAASKRRFFMPRTAIDTPAPVLDALRNDGAILPPQSRCDVFSHEAAKVQCMVCTTPAMKKGAPQVVIAFAGSSRSEQREAAHALQRLIAAGPVLPSDVRVLFATGVTLVFAPWLARADVRGIVRSVSSSLHPERVTVDSERLDTGAAIVVPGPVSQGDVALEIRQALHAFVIDVDSLWRGARRLLSRKEEMHTWFLPLGCHVVERHMGRHVCWEIGFEQFHLLEQAIELVDARLAMGKDHLLMRWSQAGDDDSAETRMPTVTLMASENTRDSRTQMARLLQNMLFLLGRLGFASSMAADLTQPAPLPAS
jgi:hypothetical protein